jgi:hypothetical protein
MEVRLMGVESTHESYANAAPQWQRCRDVCAGGDAVKARGQLYLPMPSGMFDLRDYSAYVQRAMFYNATGRTVQGLAGAILRKPPTFSGLPGDTESELEDVTSTGVALSTLIPRLLDDVLAVGRAGVLVDMPRAGTAHARPYWVPYRAEQIINWQSSLVDGEHRLSLLVLKSRVRADVVPTKPSDAFTPTYDEQYTAYTLGPDGVEIAIWKQQSRQSALPGESTLQIVDVVRPVRRGEPLRVIPFVFLGPDGTDPDICKPPLLDLVDVNLSHYRSSADLEHGRHFTALPTPWVAGVAEKTALRIGSGIAWSFSDPQARAGMLEFTGKGLSELSAALEQKERHMAVLGARLLESRATHQEAAATVRLRQSGESSALRRIATAYGEGLTRALRFHAWWNGTNTTDSILASVNQDFFEEGLTPQEAQTLMSLWQQGAISYETLYHQLSQGEWTRPGVPAADELALIDTQRGGQK